ncbi:PQQ-like beta-propeller repeat protein [Maritimibacter sp. DP1N21-5]|uniref:outer membrane protein assembly factor BamB family protein n=1 Tax=Maritimibacter sp. DP1N21-5 TaxID=2836867 RepID=UPI001C440846|nr:PQQ-like beta-propeller repeat protein [Maritimibacter sp. DP1N21-5]MBV7410029.1 PQQ-like beta-propeller repeat protein [Maritimibacter sp. DP1N21-5]
MAGTTVIRLLLIGAVAALSACAEREVIFQGQRESLFSPDPEVVGEAEAARFAQTEAEANANRAAPISLASMNSLGAWPGVAAGPSHNVPHLAFSAAPQVVFSVPIGQGSTRKYKVTAEPVVADGRVFTMDSRLQVTATSTGGGALWSADLTRPGDRGGEATAGGLAYGAGMVFASTGGGELVALNPGSGAVIWRQDLGAPGSGAPTFADGTVYVLNAYNRLLAVTASNGRVQWQLPGTPSKPSLMGSAAPAIAGENVIVPFSIGSLVAVNRQTGEPAWVVPVKGVRTGRGYSVVSEISGAPVVSGSTIYAQNFSGAGTAVTTSGQALWTSAEGATGPVTVAGGSIFMVSDTLELVRVDASTGDRIWGVPLPGYVKEKPRRRKAVYPSYGPTLAGGRLWVASGDGYLRAFSPTDGTLAASVALPAGAASRPVIVGGVAYIVTEKGTLVALR